VKNDEERSRMTQKQPDQNILDDAWDQIVGGMDWLKSVLLGEFADHRPLSAVVADMLVSFIPGVVIVTSARDAVAVILRLANHPEKREEMMEWVLLSACLIVIALPIAMAAGGAVAAGVGAIVGGIAGSELGAALRAVMLMLIKEAQKLVELVRFLQKFIKGDILKFLRAVKFVQYEKALMKAMSKITGKLLQMVKALRTHLESLRYFDTVKATIARLAEWERRFYTVQQDALKHMPKALAELDARLAKVLAQTAPKEAHTVATGVQADKTVAALPAKQRIRDTPGKVLAKVEEKVPSTVPEPNGAAKPRAKAKTKPKPKASPEAPPKDSPDPVKPPDAGANTKKQVVADAAVAAERERITQLSKEARAAEKNGDKALAAAKIEEARSILRPHLPKNPGDNWDEVVKRLDVSSPKDGAVFWSGDPLAAQKYAEGINGVTLETTAGGRIIDGWDEVNKGYAWDSRYGQPPYGRDLWGDVSKKYAEGVSGAVNAVQTPGKLWDTNTLWHNVEKPVFQDKLLTGEVSGINVFTINNSGNFIPLSNNYVDALMRLEGTAPL
jgi:hypothetical protein